MSSLNAQKAFLNNFENVVNRRVDIREDIKQYQNTLSYTSKKVDYSMGLIIYMLPSDMNLNIRSGTVGYDHKILVPDSGFSLGKNDMVNTTVPEKTSSIVSKHAHETFIIRALSKHTSAITHEEEKIALVLVLTSAFVIWYAFR